MVCKVFVTMCVNLGKYWYISAPEVRNVYSKVYQARTEPQRGDTAEIDTCRPAGACAMVATFGLYTFRPAGAVVHKSGLLCQNLY